MLAMAVGGGGFQREPQYPAGFQRADQGVGVPARGGVAGVQPSFVIRAGLRDARLQLHRYRLSGGLEFLQLRPMHGLDRRVAFQERRK